MFHEDTRELTRSDDVIPAGCRLVITAGAREDIGRSVDLTTGTLTIGRSEDCDLPLQDSRVSRAHVSLALHHGGVAVEDLQSRNGTFYLGLRIERAGVPHGATITVGSTTIALLPLATTDAQALAMATSYGELVGESLAMRQLFATLSRLETSDVNMLLVGEVGTGKERIARIIHAKSRRAAAPFIGVSCDTRDEAELKDELFGRPGRPGAVEQADHGVLFLEDADKLSASLQAGLLRVLERNSTSRSGENLRRRVSMRVIATARAAPVSLRDELSQRLAVVTLALPPLRERPEDIPRLAVAAARTQGKGRELTAVELAHLVSQTWPGNIPQLHAAVLRTLALGLEATARPAAHPAGPNDRGSSPYKDARERLVTMFEAQYVADLLQRNGGNISAAAREAKVSRKHLHQLVHRHRSAT